MKKRPAKARSKKDRKTKISLPPCHMRITLQANGLRLQLLIVYNDKAGAYSLVRDCGTRQPVWTPHQPMLYPPVTPFEEEVTERKHAVDTIFKRFKADALRLDPKARVVFKKGNP